MGSHRDKGESPHSVATRGRSRDGGRALRILVTGASGFIGFRVTQSALEQGHEVVASVRPRSASPWLKSGAAVAGVVEAELTDSEAMRRLASEVSPDLALHLAWPLGPDYDSTDHMACVGGSLALLQGLVESGCPRVVFVGTHYELAPSDNDLVEGDRVAPRNLYSTCKDAVHRVARSFVSGADTGFVWARLFNVYGPGQPDWALVPHIIRHLLEGRRCPMTTGEQVRTFLHVRDAADALLAVGRSQLRGVVHIGSEVAVSVRDLALKIANLLERPELLALGEIAARPDDAPRIVPCNDRLRDEAGFHAALDLDEGLSDTIDWWRRRISASPSAAVSDFS